MEKFQIIVASITLISLVILSLVFKYLVSEKNKDNDSNKKANSPINIFMGVLFIIVIVGLFLTGLMMCSEGNSSHDIFIEDPIHRP